MRFILVIFYLYIVAPVFAQRVIRKGTTPQHEATPAPRALYIFSDFDGRWQETERIALSGNEQAFSDTLQLLFKGTKVYSKDASSMRMSMVYDVEIAAPNRLIIGSDEYRVLSLNEKQLVLEDENYKRKFSKRKSFYYEIVGKDSIIQKLPSIPLRISAGILKGKWIVYRTSAEPGSTPNQTALIRSLKIEVGSDSANATGMISYRMQGEQLSEAAKFIFGDFGMGILSEGLHIQYQIYKADGSEFIFGEQPALLFFAKKVSD